MTVARPISVLIVDDSAMVRKLLSMGFEADPRFRVVGTAANVETAQRLLDETAPDVVTLDVELPHVDGLTWLKRIMATRPVPVVVISSLDRGSAEITMQAMELGAVDVIAKPMGGVGAGLGQIIQDICARVGAAATARIDLAVAAPGRMAARARPLWPSRNGQRVMGIGSSTGGVQALARILPLFPADSPAILIVQHMPEGFTASFAKRLDGLCAMEVREARDGDLVQDGLVLIAPGGGRHMEVRRSGALYRVALVDGAPVCFSRPSVDVMLFSLAQAAGANAVAAILTGMGRDGAKGLLRVREAGGRTIAQDAATCVVHGMPGVAAEIGAAQQILPLDAIPEAMQREPAFRQSETQATAPGALNRRPG